MATASPEPTLITLIHRLDRLEKSLGRWRVLGSAAWILLAAGLAANVLLAREPQEPNKAQVEAEADEADAVEDRVQARSFVLVDDDGKPRALLGLRADGTPALAFSDSQGKVIWKAP